MIAFSFAYLVGAIPSGYLLARYIFGIDVTQHGSGNIGATNVARVLGSKKYFFLIFFLDFIKAAGFLYLAQRYLHPSHDKMLQLGFAILLGNAYSIFLGFKGGKGVATSFGILVALFSGYVVSVFLGAWLLVLPLAGRVDVASLSASAITTLGALLGFYYVSPGQQSFLVLLTFFIFVRHRSNIQKLMGMAWRGVERRMEGR